MSRCPICTTELVPVRGELWRCPLERAEVDASGASRTYARRIGTKSQEGIAQHGYQMLWSEEKLPILEQLAEDPPARSEVGPERTWIVWGLILHEALVLWEALLLRNGYTVARTVDPDRAVAAQKCHEIAEARGLIPATWEITDDDGEP